MAIDKFSVNQLFIFFQFFFLSDDHSVASTVTTPAREVTIPAQNASVVPESSKSLNKKSNDSIIEVSSEASTNPSNNSSEPASNAPSASKNVAPLDCLLFASGFVLAFHIFQ